MTDTPATPRNCRVGICALVAIFSFSTMLGCRSFSRWHAPDFAVPQNLVSVQGEQFPFFWRTGYRPEVVSGQFYGAAEAAEQNYATARQLEAAGSPDCVGYYLQATELSWPAVAQTVQASGPSHSGNRVWEIYHSSLAKLITTGQRWGGLDPRRGIVLSTPHGSRRVGMSYTGFPWNPHDFTRLILVGDYASDRLTNIHRQAGLGVPVVVVSSPQHASRWRLPQQAFAATALLRLPNCYESISKNNETTLELLDPVRVAHLPLSGCHAPLFRDITAPIAYRVIFSEQESLPGLLRRGATDTDAKLYMIEPYQPGKIPLIFVHGLLSDPLTWADLANELRAQPDITARFQLWAYQYPTGEAFLRSAATLREQLHAIRQELDPARQDPALDRMVLIGHSMGGLISKLQVTHSGSALWDSIAQQPLETIRTDAVTRHELAKMFFFAPHPQVKRVVFVGTPHRGSVWARRLVGRLASALVTEPADRVAQHRQLITDNEGVFSPELRRRIPTSLDLLEPDSPLLHAMGTLPVSSGVSIHSIIGTGRRLLGSGPADGVVSVDSARHTGQSEKFVDARHQELHRHPAAVAEIIRILREHAMAADSIASFATAAGQ